MDPEDAYEIHVLLIRHGRRICTARNPDCAAVPAQADVPVRAREARQAVSEANLRRLSELALIGIASIWGLTFVMVKDAIASCRRWRFSPTASSRHR